MQSGQSKRTQLTYYLFDILPCYRVLIFTSMAIPNLQPMTPIQNEYKHTCLTAPTHPHHTDAQ